MNPRIVDLKQKRRFAALLMNYSCTIACDHCCFNCSQGGTHAVMAVESAVRYLAELHKLDREVHVAGGEPFMYWERLLDIVRAAFERGVAPHFVETNCSWCVSDEIARRRFGELKESGVLWMLISTDPYHLKWVPVERIARGIATAEEIFGKDTTMGLSSREELEERAALVRDQARMTAHVRRHPPMLVGRAAKEFAHLIDPKPLSELDLETAWGVAPEDTCCREWDPCWEVHVDPYGNVQTNCGIILGNANDLAVSDIMRNWRTNSATLRGISQRGVAFLLETALERGFKPAAEYPQKCYLCLKLRSFLRGCGDEFRAVFGPDEIYD